MSKDGSLKPRSVHSDEYRLLARSLKEARQNAGLTQRELAARLKKPHTFIHKAEIGERELNVIELIDYCSALGIGFIPFVSDIEKSVEELRMKVN